MALSTNTVVTLGTILLIICVLSICKQAISTIMGVVALCVVAVFVVQTTSDVNLIDFANLYEMSVNGALWLFQWAQDTFWPSLTEAARDIEQSL